MDRLLYFGRFFEVFCQAEEAHCPAVLHFSECDDGHAPDSVIFMLTVDMHDVIDGAIYVDTVAVANYHLQCTLLEAVIV